MLELFEEYERRFATARLQKPILCPWQEQDRAEILRKVKAMLRWDEKYMPEISNMEAVSELDAGTCRVLEYRYRTWPHVYGAATLYLPKTEGPYPLVFVCCGHGKQGRQTESYAAMGRSLAELGMAAMVMDNLGQGDRNLLPEFKNRGHWQAVAPFYCGLTLQGLIVMETVALIRHMQKDSRFDSNRFGACGNSGGGTLTMFLAALAPELRVLASSGYPSELDYVLTKEKVHCSCNLLVGGLLGPDMWEIYSLFAPKPLLLSSGKKDGLFSDEAVRRCYRKVKYTYTQLGAEEAFFSRRTESGHSWKLEDTNGICAFLAKQLLAVDVQDRESWPMQQTASVPMPEDAMDVEQLAQNLTGITMPEGSKLHHVFPPAVSVEDETLMRIFAQYECALWRGKD